MKTERYSRNFIRHQLSPLLQEIQPQFRKNLARSSMHFSRAQGLLDQLAEIDLEKLQKIQNTNHELHDRCINPSHGISVRSLLALFSKDIDRANNALRRWLALQGLLMPSEERLNAWWKDLQNLKDYRGSAPGLAA
jgi:tRNA(Ile)-lysidine synthase